MRFRRTKNLFYANNLIPRLIFLFSVNFIFAGCRSTNQTLQKKFKYNTNYFIGLQKLGENDIAQAEKNFSAAAKKGSGYCSRYSKIELIKLKNQRERIERWQTFIQEYPDEEAFLLAARDLFSCGEFSKIIQFTENLDLKSADNELVSLRLKSMHEKNDSRIKEEIFTWFTERDISSEHLNFFRLFNINEIFADGKTDFPAETEISEDGKDIFSGQNFYSQLINFRILVYRRIYAEAFSIAGQILSHAEKNLSFTEKSENSGGPENLKIPKLVYSDIGKAFLYANRNYLQNAQVLDKAINAAEKSAEKHSELFYLNFYAARLYDTEGEFITRAENRYKSAMKNADALGENDKFDNALWYFLRLKLKRNTNNGTDAVIENCKIWRNAEYFDDLLDLISNLLLTEGKWNDFYKVYKAIDGFASDYMTARFAYIYARLLQENLASVPYEANSKDSKKQKSDFENEAFRRALNSGGDYYYQILSINQLGLSERETEKQLCKTVLHKKGTEIDTEAEILLSGYAAFGFPEKIYPEFLKLTSNGSNLSMDSMISLSSFLKDCGEKKNEFYPQSLRIASKALKGADRKINRDELKLFFPKDYSSLIEENCEKYQIPHEIMYALVRSESFFDSTIKSSADAVGLTQLMLPTANDVARKLKTADFDLNSPETNIEFGSFYVSELYGRLNKKWLPALLSYNTGITRIRRWLQQQNRLPMDLFLEIAPYAETREYGRKLLSASCMYAWIYKTGTINETVELLFEMTKNR